MSDIAPLVRVLGSQAAIFERLLLSAHTLTLLASSGEAQFLATAADETSDLLGELAALELAREITTAAAAESLGLMGSDHALDEIVAALPDGEGAALQQLGANLRQQAIEYAAVTGAPA